MGFLKVAAGFDIPDKARLPTAPLLGHNTQPTRRYRTYLHSEVPRFNLSHAPELEDGTANHNCDAEYDFCPDIDHPTFAFPKRSPSHRAPFLPASPAPMAEEHSGIAAGTTVAYLEQLGH